MHCFEARKMLSFENFKCFCIAHVKESARKCYFPFDSKFCTRVLVLENGEFIDLAELVEQMSKVLLFEIARNLKIVDSFQSFSPFILLHTPLSISEHYLLETLSNLRF